MYYRKLNDYLRERFGCKVYKLTLDGGMTCPNRDGTLGTRGCIFCSRRGSGDFAAKRNPCISAQMKEAKRLLSAKAGDARYIAYFQSYTNTYAEPSYLEKLFREAIEPPDIVALSVATRPDCITEEALSMLAKLNQEKPVWVELGLQTIHEKTADFIRRGYVLSCYDEALHRLKGAGLEVITHMILGLPGESRPMMVETADYIGKSAADGIKLQLLHVLDDADLAEAYYAGQFSVLEMEEYIEILAECIQRLPPDMVIHRLTGDGAKAHLVAPLWSGNKKAVLNAVQRYFQEQNVIQGAHYGR